MNNQNEAKVFGEGDITIVMNMLSSNARIYVGTQQIGFLQSLKLELDSSKTNPQLEFNFYQSYSNKEINMKIEEQVRLVKQTAPWAKIIR